MEGDSYGSSTMTRRTWPLGYKLAVWKCASELGQVKETCREFEVPRSCSVQELGRPSYREFVPRPIWDPG